jgi:hypothetical protein
MSKKHDSRGGSRKGSGRKKLPDTTKVAPLTIQCYPDTIKQFKELTIKRELTQRGLMERMVQNDAKRKN